MMIRAQSQIQLMKEEVAQEKAEAQQALLEIEKERDDLYELVRSAEEETLVAEKLLISITRSFTSVKKYLMQPEADLLQIWIDFIASTQKSLTFLSVNATVNTVMDVVREILGKCFDSTNIAHYFVICSVFV